MPTDPPRPVLHLTSRLLAICYGTALAVTGAASLAWAAAAAPPIAWKSLGLGWAIATGNAAAGLAIKLTGLGGDVGWFFFWALGVNGVRAAILVTIVIAVHHSDMASLSTFDVAVWTGYFSCLFAEVVLLHQASTAGYRRGL